MVKVDFGDVITYSFNHTIKTLFGFVFKLDHVPFNRTLFKFDRIKLLYVFRIPRAKSIFWW